MNAQEAIEKMEAELSSVELLMGDYSDESVETYLEALTIVLESAKLLHDVIDLPTTEVREAGFIKCFITGTISVDKNIQKKIGIEEGADS